MSCVLFQIRLSHEYYSDKSISQLTLSPDSETRVFCQRYRLLPHHQQGVFSLNYYGSNRSEEFISSLVQLLKGAPLRFILKSDHDDFFVISDVPLTQIQQLFFSSTHRSAKQELKLSFQPRQLINREDVGMVEIYPQDLAESPHFAIHINSRQIYWHYIVVNHSRVSLRAPLISNRQGIDFDSGQDVTLTTAESALLFRSGEQRFAMAQKNPHYFYLLDQQQILLSGLPPPITEKVNMEQVNGQQYIYSPIYVYL